MLRKVPAILFILQISTSCLPALSCACPEISTLEASQQMLTMGNDIRHHNRLYYEKAQPLISDAEYDRLFASLVRLEDCFPALVAADSPTRRVGSAAAAETHLVKHERPMLSLSSATGSDAVAALLRRVAAVGEVQLLVQPKVDGVPVELIYEVGRLVSASTRGDGRFGAGVTARVREIQGIPHLLTGTFPERVVVRGEVYANLPLLQKYRASTEMEKYAGPRHLAAGVLQARKPDPAAVAVLRLFPFELVTTGSVGDNLCFDRQALQMLAKWGFPVAISHTHPAETFADVQALYRGYLANRELQPFAMDGIVVKVDDLVLRKRLGDGERAPFWAAAWKFPPDSAKTKVVKIRWTVGRTGRRTPIAEVEPVRLGSVQVTRVSLHNNAEIARLDIATGDQVVIALVGDVIPQVIEVVGRTARRSDSGAPSAQVAEPALDACLHDSPVCRHQFLAKTVYFVSKSGLDIAGLGRKRLQKLIEAGLVYDLPSLFLLKTGEVAAVPGFGAATAMRLTASIRAAGQAGHFRLVTALGIPGVGPKTVQSLARKFSSLDALLAAEQEQLITLSGIDDRALKIIRTFFNSPGGDDLLLKFRELGML